ASIQKHLERQETSHVKDFALHFRFNHSSSPVTREEKVSSSTRVTLKITRDRKPIAPSYTTKVPSGTLLVDILNKAAGAEGAFNKYESIYYGGTYKGVLLGYYIIAMDGIKQDPATKSFWMIIDEKTKDYTPCGISSYVPGDGSTTIFDFSPLKLDKPCPPYRGSGYCKKALPSGQNPQIYTQLKIFEKTGKFILQGLDSYNNQDCYFMAFRLAADTSPRTVEPTYQAITMNS
ncbi:unnamed protein product, partial [Porites evermanni]